MSERSPRFSTRAVHVGQEPEPVTGATIPPIHITSTYTQEAPGKHKGFEYSRTRNPTRDALQQVLASLEEGQAAASFASGLAASQAAIGALLKSGDSLVAYADCYGGTYRLLERVFKPWGLEPRYTLETRPETFAGLIDETTGMVWIETPTNPMLRLLDIEAIGQAIRQREKQTGRKVWFVVDNTFATPALQQPLTLGADLVVHSTTKYLGGHSDVVGGAVVARRAADLEPVVFYQNAAGAVSSPFDCYLTHRGIKTLELRMARHCENAMRVARWAAEQPQIEKVIYPGLPEHPDHELARRQMRGFGGMVTIVLRGGLDAATAFMRALRVFACAESLGGVESLANHPAIMTHASVPRERREALGIVDGLVRLSVGIEDADDLIEDLAQALGQVG